MTEEEMPLEIAMWRKKKSNVEQINLSQGSREENGPETEKVQTVKNLKRPDNQRHQNSSDAELLLHMIYEGEFIFKPCFDFKLTGGTVPQLSG